MNKTIIGTVAAAAAAMGLLACDGIGGDRTTETKNMTIESKINAPTQSMVTPGAFEAGDKISIYAWTGDKDQVPAAAGLVINNSINTYEAGKWTAEPIMPWSDETTEHYFIGVHPAKAVSDFVADTYDQTPDLLVAVNVAGRTAMQGNVPLEFDHVMSRLVVELIFRNQFGGSTPTVSGVTSELKTGATVNYLSKTTTPLATTVAQVSLSPISANTSYSLICAPQTVHNVYITIGEKVYTYNNAQGFTLEAGKERTIELSVGRDVVELANVTVNDWGTSETITGGEAQ